MKPMLTRKLRKLGTVLFSEQPVDQPVWRKKRLKMVMYTWRCIWTYRGKSRELICKPGYIYDGASVPRFAWTLSGLRPDGLIRAPSLGHDIMYRHDFYLIRNLATGEPVFDITRKEADWFFYMAMEHAGMDNTQTTIAYRAVRIGGRKHWGGPSPYEK